MVLGKDWMFPRKNRTMKTTFIATLLVAFVTAFSTAAQPDSDGTIEIVGLSKVDNARAPHLAGGNNSTTTGFQIRIIPVLLPIPGTEGLWEIMSSLENDLLSEVFRKDGGYAVPTNGIVFWKNFVYAKGGVTDWPVVQQLILVSSKDRKASVSLDRVRIESTSTGGLNGQYQVPEGFGYSEVVFGIDPDGTRVTSGPANREVETLVMVTKMPLFTGGATTEGLKQVENYVTGAPNFKATYTVKVAGDATSFGMAEVSIKGHNGAKPTMIITSNNGVMITLTAGDFPREYTLMTSPTIDGPWSKATILYSSQSWQEEGGDPSKFFKVVPTLP